MPSGQGQKQGKLSKTEAEDEDKMRLSATWPPNLSKYAYIRLPWCTKPHKTGAFEGLLAQSPINMHTFCYPGARNTTKQGALESLLAQSPINMHTFCDLGAKRVRKQGHSTSFCKNAYKTRVQQPAAPPTAEVIFPSGQRQN